VDMVVDRWVGDADRSRFGFGQQNESSKVPSQSHRKLSKVIFLDGSSGLNKLRGG
jgi:hypothetical protein